MQKRENYLDRQHKPGIQWQFLTQNVNSFLAVQPILKYHISREQSLQNGSMIVSLHA